MSRSSRVVFTFLILALIGCATFNVRSAVEVSRAELLDMSHNTTGDCLWYKGSDDSFHYIFRNDISRKTVGFEGAYKIRVEDLPLKKTFAVGQGEYPLLSLSSITLEADESR
jgi:hypothetical protein